MDLGNHNDDTPLHIACREGHFQIVEFLLDNGAHINARNYIDNTPLHLACHNGYYSIVQLLVERGALLNIRNKFNFTPLHFASQDGHYKLVKFLVEHGADVNLRDKKKWTPSHWVSKTIQLQIINLLVQHGGKIKMDDVLKMPSPLYWASWNGEYRIVLFLLENGVEVNHEEKSTLEIAIKKGHHNIVKLLLSYGADPSSIQITNLNMKEFVEKERKLWLKKQSKKLKQFKISKDVENIIKQYL